MKPRIPLWVPWWLLAGRRVSDYDKADRSMLLFGIFLMCCLSTDCGTGLIVLSQGIHYSAEADGVLLCSLVLTVSAASFTFANWAWRSKLNRQFREDARRHLSRPYYWSQ